MAREAQLAWTTQDSTNPGPMGLTWLSSTRPIENFYIRNNLCVCAEERWWQMEHGVPLLDPPGRGFTPWASLSAKKKIKPFTPVPFSAPAAWEYHSQSLALNNRPLNHGVANIKIQGSAHIEG